MDAALTTDRSSDESGSLTTAMPVVRTAAGNHQDPVSSTSELTFADLGSSVTSSTTDKHFRMKSSKIPPMLTENAETDIGTVSSEDLAVTTDGLQLESRVQIRTSSAQAVTGSSRLETTVQLETGDFSRQLNLTDVTTAVPLRADHRVVHSMQPQDIAQTRISEAGQKTSVFHDATTTARRDTDRVSASYKRSFSLQSALISSRMLSTQLQDVSQAHISEAGQKPSVLLDVTTATRDTGGVSTPYKRSISLPSMSVSSTVPQDISQTRISEVTEKTSVLHDATTTARRDAGQYVSTSYKRSFGLQSSSSVSSSLSKSSTVTAAIQMEISSHVQSSSSRSWSSAGQETTSQATVASVIRHVDDYTSALYNNGE